MTYHFLIGFILGSLFVFLIMSGVLDKDLWDMFVQLILGADKEDEEYVSEKPSAFRCPYCKKYEYDKEESKCVKCRDIRGELCSNCGTFNTIYTFSQPTICHSCEMVLQ